MRETAIEKKLKKKIESHRGMCLKFISPGTRGVPDRIVFLNKKIYFVELKAPKKKPRDLQEYRRAQLEAHGQVVILIDSDQKVDEFIKAVLADEI